MKNKTFDESDKAIYEACEALKATPEYKAKKDAWGAVKATPAYKAFEEAKDAFDELCK